MHMQWCTCAKVIDCPANFGPPLQRTTHGRSGCAPKSSQVKSSQICTLAAILHDCCAALLTGGKWAARGTARVGRRDVAKLPHAGHGSPQHQQRLHS